MELKTNQAPTSIAFVLIELHKPLSESDKHAAQAAIVTAEAMLKVNDEHIFDKNGVATQNPLYLKIKETLVILNQQL